MNQESSFLLLDVQPIQKKIALSQGFLTEMTFQPNYFKFSNNGGSIICNEEFPKMIDNHFVHPDRAIGSTNCFSKLLACFDVPDHCFFKARIHLFNKFKLNINSPYHGKIGKFSS